mgnify:CR=1 FL=1
MKFFDITFPTAVEIVLHYVIRFIEYCRGIRNPKKIPAATPGTSRICETIFCVCLGIILFLIIKPLLFLIFKLFRLDFPRTNNPQPAG